MSYAAFKKGKTDRKNLILYRAKEVYVILNKYPYNNGHMMVVPNRHTADLSELSTSEMNALWDFGLHATDALKRSINRMASTWE